MSKVLKNPIKAKSKTQTTQKAWTFAAPSYDNRSSDSICAGWNYGTGFKSPVGSFKGKSVKEGPIPQEAEAFSPKEIFQGKDIQG